MKLQARLSLVVLLIFVCGWLIAGLTAYKVEQGNARAGSVHTAEVLLSTAIAARSYTSDEIRPLLADKVSEEFITQSVPSYAAQQLFSRLGEEFQSYNYAERVLNPTNRQDLAEGWQVELIREFLSDPNLKEIIGERKTRTGEELLYVAQPIQIKKESCLECHGRPEDAPPNLIKTYGNSNGFGWKLDEIVGTRLISIPISIPKQRAQEELLSYLLLIASIFLVAYTAVSLIVKNWILSPLDTISQMVEQISLSNLENSQLPDAKSNYDEIGKLNKSVNRLLISLRRALSDRRNK